MEVSTIFIVSDLHVGGGTRDPGDDHVYSNNQFENFITQLTSSAEGQHGTTELYINGDFLEFAQTLQHAYVRLAHDFWCSEDESCEKLQAIVDGHPGIFDALKRFHAGGNLITIAAGNHDVDLYWPKVQHNIRDRVGTNVAFDLGSQWYERFGGRLQISHGHQDDKANRFAHWDCPIKSAEFDIRRLEMCPGTRFMVEVVNKLELDYPFADNLQPATKLATVLLREDKRGLAMAAWTFLTFVLSSPATAGANSNPMEAALLRRFRTDNKFLDKISRELAPYEGGITPALLREKGRSIEGIASILALGLTFLPFDKWTSLFASGDGFALGSEDGRTLGIIGSVRNIDYKKEFRKIATRRFADVVTAQIVVLGHTHLPDSVDDGDRKYFNPGSWTRYLVIEREATVTMDQLQDESKFPYELNCVKVSQIANGALSSELVTLERSS